MDRIKKYIFLKDRYLTASYISQSLSFLVTDLKTCDNIRHVSFDCGAET